MGSYELGGSVVFLDANKFKISWSENMLTVNKGCIMNWKDKLNNQM